MKEIKFNGDTVKVFEATGFNDGYYWDMNAMIEFREKTYQLYDAGSGSGYVLCCSGITNIPFDRLYGEEQGEVEEHDWGYFENAIKHLLRMFIESGANTSWTSQDDDHWNTHVFIDGVEQKEDEEES